MIYAVVAWALKTKIIKASSRSFLSYYNLLVLWPLGKWKFQEIEIELAKLKEFDKEYNLLVLN